MIDDCKSLNTFVLMIDDRVMRMLGAQTRRTTKGMSVHRALTASGRKKHLLTPARQSAGRVKWSISIRFIDDRDQVRLFFRTQTRVQPEAVASKLLLRVDQYEGQCSV
ncbi:hypothetical protein MRB53_038413 [Persea americana]|nr:hypothetical protein MRB53_038413 [Persea americana]